MDLNGTKIEENGSPAVTKEDVKEMIMPFALQQGGTYRNSSRCCYELQGCVNENAKTNRTQRPCWQEDLCGGLDCGTTSDTLKTIFSSFGEVEECIVPIRNSTGNGRGQESVTLRHIDGGQRALKEPRILIDGRKTESKRVLNQKPQTMMRKFYIGHIPMEMTNGRLSAMFAQFEERFITDPGG